MGSFRAVLEVKGEQMDVLFSSIEFSRKTDNKGKPVTSVFGGRITVTIESTENTSVIEAMVNDQFKSIEGTITFKKTEEDSSLKQISFSNSYIVYYKELFRPNKDHPMTILLTFSAEEITIGNAFFNSRWR